MENMSAMLMQGKQRRARCMVLASTSLKVRRFDERTISTIVRKYRSAMRTDLNCNEEFDYK